MSTPKVDLTNPIYNDDDAAREHLEKLLWPNGPVCPHCGAGEDRVTKLQGKSTRPGVYKCKDCRKPFTVTVNTVMERSKVRLCKWVLAAQLSWPAPKASGSCINNLVKPRTPKQKARHFLRWRSSKS